MTLCVPRATAPVAAGVAAHLLDLVGDPATATVGWEIDWQGPLAIPLADEHAVQAACGIMHVHGRAAGRPAPLAVDYASTVAGVLAAQGVCAALLARAAGADVTQVRTSVSQAALLALAQYLAAATADGDEPEHGLPSRAGTREGPAQAGCPFVSADGVRFELEALDAELWLDFWQLLGADRADTGRGWRSFQQRFATATCSLPLALSATVRRASFTAVRSAADRSGAAVLPVREDPHPPTVTPPWTLTPFPEPGGTTIGRARTAGAPLHGLRVVESARRVQGPMAGHVLRLLGADVVRIEPPGGDPMRGIPPMAGTCSARFSALSAKKSVVEIDFTTAAGRQAVRALVSEADVFLHNWAPGKAARLGLDAEDLRSVRPGLVYAWAALLARLRTGRGGRVDSSLYSASALVPRGRRRPEALDRPLRTRDGYVSLGPQARERPERLARALGLGTSAGADAIASRARTRPTADWLPGLAAAGVAATPVCTSLADLARDPRFAPALAVGEYAAPLAPWEFS
jgi:crotonobetainyl-CoA:carnitine CoA-transferase CaiB-like acyl-CoA transferase